MGSFSYDIYNELRIYDNTSSAKYFWESLINMLCDDRQAQHQQELLIVSAERGHATQTK